MWVVCKMAALFTRIICRMPLMKTMLKTLQGQVDRIWAQLVDHGGGLRWVGGVMRKTELPVVEFTKYQIPLP